MTRRRACRALALGAWLALLAAAPALAKDAARWPQGLYGSVRMSDETGDLGGMELRLFAQGGLPMVEVVICEGWCNASHVVPLESTETGFAFRFVERYEPGQGPREYPVRVLLTPRHGGFSAIPMAGDDLQTRLWEKPAILRRLKRPFGLSVARSQQDGPPAGAGED